jgi:hypothetical protein
VKTLAHKASKKNTLGLYASALKRQQDKESKAKQTKRCAIKWEDSSLPEDSMSVHNLEKPIPCKLIKKTPVTKVITKAKPAKKSTNKDAGC